MLRASWEALPSLGRLLPRARWWGGRASAGAGGRRTHKTQGQTPWRAAPQRGGGGAVRGAGRRRPRRHAPYSAPRPRPPSAACRAAGAERGGGGGARAGSEGRAAGPSRVKRSAPAKGGRRQYAAAHGPLLRQPSSLSPAARAWPGGAGATAGAGGWNCEQEPRAPERRVSATALARGRSGGRTSGRTHCERTLGGEGAICGLSVAGSKGLQALHRAAQHPNLETFWVTSPRLVPSSVQQPPGLAAPPRGPCLQGAGMEAWGFRTHPWPWISR